MSSSTIRIRIEAVENVARARSLVAATLEVTGAEATALLEAAPIALPRVFDSEDAAALAAELVNVGVRVGTEVVASPPVTRCATHEHLLNDGACVRCGRWVCTVCRGMAGGDRRCPGCAAKARRSDRWRHRRIGVLLLILFGVLLYAWRVTSSRAARTEWNQTLAVGFVLVEREPISPELIATLRERTEALEDALARDAARYGIELAEPIEVIPYGSIQDDRGLPSAPASADYIERIRYKFELTRFLAPIDERAEVSSSLDARVYLFLSSADDAEPRFVEGLAEFGGDVGVIEVDIAEDTVDLALFAATHELFHLLGATDKYDATGAVIAPIGLADPEREPLYPQTDAELMSRGVALSPEEFGPVVDLGQLRIGQTTALEIGWTEAEQQ